MKFNSLALAGLAASLTAFGNQRGPESVALTGKGVKRVTGNSLAGRQMRQAKGAVIADDSRIPADIRAHNEAIEAKRQERLSRRKEKRHGK